MAFNGSGDGPHNKRLCTGSEEDGNHRSHASGAQEEPRRKRHGDAGRPNHILLLTVFNPVYPITVDVLHTICQLHGQVQRIVIFKKNGVQAMVEFESIESATRAKEALHNADIYSGCCTLKIDYAKPEKLNVHKNDPENWDYTVTAPRELNPSTGGGRPQPLLQEPHFGGRPQPFRKTASVSISGSRYQPYRRNVLNNKNDRFQDEPLGKYGNNFNQDRFDDGFAPPFPDNFGGHDGFGRGGLMKDPQSGGRGGYGPVGPGGPGGSVMMVYGLDPKVHNTDSVFNLMCLYGNVARVKFLKTKEGTAMVQMGDTVAVERCIMHLNNIPIGNNKLQVAFSKQTFLSEVTNPFPLFDKTPSFKEFTGNKNNRFISLAQASKNRIQPPSKILHFFNTPPGIEETTILDVFKDYNVSPPISLKMFPNKSERSSSGLMEFNSITDAIQAIMACNHAAIKSAGTKFPFIMKLCFSSSRNVSSGWHDNSQNLSDNIQD